MQRQHFPIPDCSDALLFGAHPDLQLVAVEKCGAGEFELFYRQGTGPGSSSLRKARELYQPFLYITHPRLVEDCGLSLTLEGLEGRGELRHLVHLPNWHAATQLARHLRQTTGTNLSDPRAPFFMVNEEATQFMLVTGRTLFKGLPFETLHRMQVDIETWCDPRFDFPNAQRESDRIIAISLSDSTGWECCLAGHELEEAELILRFVALVHERDPDVIEGHNLLRFDLPYLEARAARYNLTLSLGRDGSIPRHHTSRFFLGDRHFHYRKYLIYGRHVIDTMLLARLYSLAYPRLNGLGLKDIAVQLGVSPEGRTYLDGAGIWKAYAEDLETLKRYSMDDVRETGAISSRLLYRYYLECQMVPLSLHGAMVRPLPLSLDLLFLRDYLSHRQALPLASKGKGPRIVPDRALQTGLTRRALLLDVSPLRFQALRELDHGPAGDARQTFAALRLRFDKTLATLTPPRPNGPTHCVETPEEVLHHTFRELLLGLADYLGADGVRFADFPLARQLKELHQRQLQRLHHRLHSLRASPLLQTQEHLWVALPPGESDQQAEVRLLADLLELGVHPPVWVAQRFQALLVQGGQELAQADSVGRLMTRGNGFRSSQFEPYLQAFIDEALTALLTTENADLRALLAEHVSRLQRGELPIARLCKRELLSESLTQYQGRVASGILTRREGYELALAAGLPYLEGDHLAYYYARDHARGAGSASSARVPRLIGQWSAEAPDEDRGYYQAQLEAACTRLEALLASKPS